MIASKSSRVSPKNLWLIVYLLLNCYAKKFVSIFVLGLVIASLAIVCQGQDYDDDGYGGQGGQGEGDNYSGGGANQGYGNDDGYNANAPQYQQNVDSDSSNNNPSGYSSPQGGSDADGDYEGDDNSAAASSNSPTYARVKRSIGDQVEPQALATQTSKMRVKRHSKYIGPVYTYVKTDKHANFKWGVSRKP